MHLAQGLGLIHASQAPSGSGPTEALPLVHTESGCVFTGDVRLDNRGALSAQLSDGRTHPSDAMLVLLAYLRWGQVCVDRIVGDFAFAVWDPRIRQLFAARDRFGVRPLYYSSGAVDGTVVFASDARSVVSHPDVSAELNESRIADYLVLELEGIDQTSTFFRHVHRLPPAHSLVVSPAGVRIDRYWTLDAGEPLQLGSDRDYSDAFLEHFTRAVDRRLCSSGTTGSMLSGGLDSGAVVAVARDLLAAAGAPHLQTFSATSPDGSECVETRAARRSMQMSKLIAHEVGEVAIGHLLPQLIDRALAPDEPFDGWMTLPRAVYLSARRAGVSVMLDGVAGDLLLTGSNYLPRLIRSGHWREAWSEVRGSNSFWKEDTSPLLAMARAARSAAATPAIRRLRDRLSGARRQSHRARGAIADSVIETGFAHRIRLSERLDLLDANGLVGFGKSFGTDCAEALVSPYLSVARERYDRAAATVAVEPRDPFLDLDLVSFCVRLPGNQRVRGGWPKHILRESMRNRLPEEVRLRPGKEHLGASFTAAVLRGAPERFRQVIEDQVDALRGYVREDVLSGLLAGPVTGQWDQRFYEVAVLGAWLQSVRSDAPSAVVTRSR
jgi:asparagine synthase (glutamine-hydrolysing)